MKIWEATDIVCCYNVADDDYTKRIRLVHLPEEPDGDQVVAFLTLLMTLLPDTYSEESVQILKRMRYLPD